MLKLREALARGIDPDQWARHDYCHASGRTHDDTADKLVAGSLAKADALLVGPLFGLVARARSADQTGRHLERLRTAATAVLSRCDKPRELTDALTDLERAVRATPANADDASGQSIAAEREVMREALQQIVAMTECELVSDDCAAEGVMSCWVTRPTPAARIAFVALALEEQEGRDG